MKFLLIISIILNTYISLKAWTIILPQKATVQEKTAAAELNNILSASIKNKLLLNDEEIEFHIGNTAEALKNKYKFHDQEYLVQSHDNKLFLCGGGTYGTIYATAFFLEKYIGVRFWNTVENYIPRHETIINLQNINIRKKPHFTMRWIYCDPDAKRDNGRFAVMNRLTSFSPNRIFNKYGGEKTYGSPSHVHSMGRYITGNEFFHKKPELFALIRNKRDTKQLCLSNPEVEKILWEKLKLFILQDEKNAQEKQEPSPKIYDISQNDNVNNCSCSRCNSIRRKYGNTESGLQIWLLNKIAKKLKSFRPDVKLSTLAYVLTEKPPVNLTVADNIQIRLCNTTNNYVGSINDKSEKYFRDIFQKWAAISSSMAIWDYGISFFKPACGLPYPSEFFIQDNLKFYKNTKVESVFIERENPIRSDMHTMKLYLNAKLMENPDADFNNLFKDFLSGYYGKAADYIEQYRRLLLNSVKNKKTFISGMTPPAITFTHLDYQTLSQADKLLQAAEDAVENDTVLKRRVREARASIDEAVLILIRKLNIENPGNHFNKEIPNIRKRLYNTLKNNTDFYLFRNQKRIYENSVLAPLKIYDDLPLTIPAVENNKKSQFFDIPVETISCFFHANPLVTTPEVVSGYAKITEQNKLPVIYGLYDFKHRKTVWQSAIIKEEQIKNIGYNWYWTEFNVPENKYSVNLL